MSFWDSYEKVTQEESGGGGIVALVRVDMGYKVYVAGVDQADTFFGVADAANRDQAKGDAQAFGRENGAPRGPQWGIQLRAYREDGLSRGQPVTWKADRFFNTDAWTSACKEVVVPSLRDNDIAPPWEGWARIGFKPDPYKVAMGESGMTDQDQEGNPRYPQVAYVVETFANQEAAYGGVDVADPADVAFPLETILPDFLEGTSWDDESWQQVIDDIKVQSSENKLTPNQLKDYLVGTYLDEEFKDKVTMKDVLKMLK
jgi:hypothetical protein